MREFREGQKWQLTADLPNGRWLSTVSLCVDHGFGGEARWFETMLFPRGEWGELRCRRYRFKHEAQRGHAQILGEEIARCWTQEGYDNAA